MIGVWTDSSLFLFVRSKIFTAQLTYINYRFSTNLYPPSRVSLMTIWSWCMIHSSTCFHVIWKLIERQFNLTFVIVSAVWHILWPTIYTDPRTWTKEVKSCLILKVDMEMKLHLFFVSVADTQSPNFRSPYLQPEESRCFRTVEELLCLWREPIPKCQSMDLLVIEL